MTRYFLLSLLQRAPLLLVLFAGLLLALARWRRHPTISLITVIGILLYTIKLFAITALNYWLPSIRESMDWSYATANSLYIAVHVVSDFGYAIFIIIMVVAAFMQRKPQVAASS